ncbi:hypothetical protein T07_612 [Trichinella nelsoni]|uniref:Uncharacterized protein n=1 Tax=Trichinella nelsoni TaxID=6336 RepID=A0A0V0RH31_9BILA|nr:hypothetical protein T07_612 [Trichinella nelsoni]
MVDTSLSGRVSTVALNTLDQKLTNNGFQFAMLATRFFLLATDDPSPCSEYERASSSSSSSNNNKKIRTTDMRDSIEHIVMEFDPIPARLCYLATCCIY